MLDSFECIVLHCTKYGEKSLIIKCLSETGIQSVFLPSYLRKGKNIFPFLFYPLVIIEVETKSINKTALPRISSVGLSYIPKNLYQNIAKQTITLFMADLLFHHIKEENDAVNDIYNYTLNALKLLDKASTLPSFFPIKFGFNIASILGYGISVGEEEDKFFDYKRGLFISQKFSHVLNEKQSNILKQILLTDTEYISKIPNKDGDGKIIFQSMLKFIRNKIPEGGLLKSPQILNAIFR